VLLEGNEVRIGSPRDAVALGIAYLPEDRKVQALVLPMNVRENLTLAVHPRPPPFSRLPQPEEGGRAHATYVTSLRIRIATQEQVVTPVRRQPAEGGHREVARDLPRILMPGSRCGCAGM